MKDIKYLIENAKKLIAIYFERAKTDCVAQSLTKNQIQKMFWRYVKSEQQELTLEEVFDLKMINHNKHIETQIRNSNFQEKQIGSIEVLPDRVIIRSDEHGDYTIYKPLKKIKKDWVEKAISNYERERCCAIIDGKIYTRLDVSK